MTRMTGPDCVVMCNLINTYIHTYIHTDIHTYKYIHTYRHTDIHTYKVCAPSELQFGARREGGGTREAGRTVAESLVVLYRVGTHQIRRRQRAARLSTSQGRV